MEDYAQVARPLRGGAMLVRPLHDKNTSTDKNQPRGRQYRPAHGGGRGPCRSL